jgi:plastocyanin
VRRRLPLLSVAAVSLAVVASACGGGSSNVASSPLASSPSPASPSAVATSPSTPAGPSCSPGGTELKVASLPAALAFDTKCLAAPAGTPFSIEFDNRTDGVPHDVSIATEGLIDVLFEGKVVTGPEDVTYHVGPLQAGTYTFYCKVHPSQMNGTFVVA